MNQANQLKVLRIIGVAVLIAGGVVFLQGTQQIGIRQQNTFTAALIAVVFGLAALGFSLYFEREKGKRG